MSEEERVLRHFMDGKKLVLIDLESETIQLDKNEDKVKNQNGYTKSWDYTIDGILRGCWKLYEKNPKPKLDWNVLADGLFESDKNGYFIIEFNNGWILKHDPSVGEGYNFIAFDEDFKTIKQIAQKHYEENN